jgi:hypothetical protein
MSSQVPLLLGSNENEGDLFNPLPVDVTADGVAAALLQMFGANLTAAILKVYPLDRYSSPWDAFRSVLVDVDVDVYVYVFVE